MQTQEEDNKKDDIRRKKKTKLFNKLYVDMQESLNSSVHKKLKIHAISSYKTLQQFEKILDSNFQMYTNHDEKLFEKSVILQRVFFNRPQLSTKNKEVVWKYIHSMYSLVKEENKEVVAIHQKDGLEGLVESLMNNENSGFKSIVDDISAQLQKASIGKNLDEQTIIKDLMSGNLESSGIDFKKIIESTSKNLEKKINDGEIDKNEIMKTTDKIKNTLNFK